MPINSKRWHRFFLFIAESGLVALVVFFLSAMGAMFQSGTRQQFRTLNSRRLEQDRAN